MPKILMLLICIVGVTLRLSTSTTIECEYKTGDWFILQNVCYCAVIKNPNITTQEAAMVTSITGSHQSGNSNADVVGFVVQFETLNYFPRGLETYFKNLKGVEIYKCNLKEIHQEDLKPFSNLVELRLQKNSIEILEEGLFDFNPDLEFIAFYGNKIVHIEPNIFDHLSKLSSLWLSLNSCINKYAENSTSGVKDVIKLAQVQCTNSEFSSFKEQLESLDNDSKILNFEKFTENLLNFEKTSRSSKFSNFRPLNYKLDALKESKLEGIIFKMTSDIDTKVSNLSDLVIDVRKNVDDIKSCKTNLDGFGPALNALESGQTSIKGSINTMCTKASIDQVQSVQNILKSSVDSLSTSLNVVKNDISTSMVSLESSVCTKQSILEVKDIQKIISDSVSKTEVEFGNFQNYFNVSIDNLEKSIQKFEGIIIKKTSDLDTKVGKLSDLVTTVQKSVNDVKSWKTKLDGFGSALNVLKTGQNGIKGSINNVCTKASINQVLSGQNNIKSTVDAIKSTLNIVKTDVGTSIKSLESLVEIKSIQKVISDSVIKTEIEFGNYQNYFNASIDNLQISLQQGLTDINALKTSTKAELATLEASTDALILLTSKGVSDIKSSLHDFKKTTDHRFSSMDASIDTLKTDTNDRLHNVDVSFETLKTTANHRFSNIDASVTSLNGSISSSLKFTNDQLKSSHDQLQSTQDQLKSTQDDMKSSIKDIEAALSDLKTSQNDRKLIINKIKDSQNDVKIQMNSMKVQMSEYIEDKLKSFGEKMDGQLSDFKVEMRKELTNSHQKISTTLESLLEQKLEKILTDKLTEIFSEKFTNIIGFN
ncbi:putative leucine-rich repeat-containing protein DDB_G0290503 [Chironomus tepperi]|uniref:putative leucine-rich repeat-containing protein DDB_G0290503 n=1 Tax=Chironomus tepperi TaxID=113505 RepID=UPI00391F1610